MQKPKNATILLPCRNAQEYIFSFYLHFCFHFSACAPRTSCTDIGMHTLLDSIRNLTAAGFTIAPGGGELMIFSDGGVPL